MQIVHEQRKRRKYRRRWENDSHEVNSERKRFTSTARERRSERARETKVISIMMKNIISVNDFICIKLQIFVCAHSFRSASYCVFVPHSGRDYLNLLQFFCSLALGRLDSIPFLHVLVLNWSRNNVFHMLCCRFPIWFCLNFSFHAWTHCERALIQSAESRT